MIPSRLRDHPPSFTCCSVRVDALDLTAATDQILDAAADEIPRSVFLCNAFNLSLASRDLAYRSVLNRGWLNLADGWPVRAVSLLGFRALITEPPSGSELLMRVWEQGQRRGITHGFLGSNDLVLSQLKDALVRGQNDPAAITVMNPLITSSSISDLVDAAVLVLRDRQPDIVWVGLGTPKQDQCIDALQARAPGVYVAVGAAFDFVAGTKHRAPVVVRRVGLEWLHRFFTEPRRLWRRYLVGNTLFVIGLLIRPPHRVYRSVWGRVVREDPDVRHLR